MLYHYDTRLYNNIFRCYYVVLRSMSLTLVSILLLTSHDGRTAAGAAADTANADKINSPKSPNERCWCCRCQIELEDGVGGESSRQRGPMHRGSFGPNVRSVPDYYYYYYYCAAVMLNLLYCRRVVA